MIKELFRKYKVYLASFIILYLLIALIRFIQVDYFTEEGVYAQYTLSVIQDQDLNIFNQIKDQRFKWLVTETHYHPDFEHSGITIFSTPFYLFTYLKLALFSGEVDLLNIKNYFYAHIIFTVFFISLGLILLQKTSKKLFSQGNFNHALLFLASTPFTWYTFFQSTSTNSFGFFYTCLSLFYITTSKESDRLRLFYIGILFGFGFVIRIQLAWVGIALLYFLYKERKHFIPKVLFFIAGMAPAFLLLSINQVARGSGGSYALLNYFDLSIGTSFINSLIGENGYLVLAPSLIICFFIYLYLVLQKETPLLLKLIGFPPLVLFTLYNFTWALMDGYIGRHQQSFLPIFCLVFIYFMGVISKHPKFKKGFIYLMLTLCCWNLICNFWYLSVDHHQYNLWKFIYPIDLPILRDGLGAFLSQRTPSIFFRRIYELLPYTPLLVLGSFLLIRIKNSNKMGRVLMPLIACYMLFTYTSITFLNYSYGKENVSKLKEENALEGVVVGNNESLYIFDDYIQVLNDSIRYYKMKNNCSKVSKLIKVRQNYVDKVRSYVIIDNGTFLPSLIEGTYRSNIDSSNSSLDLLFRNNCMEKE